MDEQENTLNAGESPQTGSLPVEQTATRAEETSETTEPTGSETTEGSQADDKKGANARIRELAREKNEYKAKSESLADQMAKLTQGVSPLEQYAPQQAPAYQPPQEDQAITREQYEMDVMRRADALVTLKLKQQEHINRVNQESSEVIAKYDQLNPDSDKFDRDLSETLTDTILRVVKADPTASVKKIAESFMKPYTRSVQQQVGEATEDVAKQAKQSAVKPTGTKVAEKPFGSLSLAEMEKKLGVMQT